LSEIMAFLSARDEQGRVHLLEITVPNCPWAIVKVLQSLQLVSIMIFP